MKTLYTVTDPTQYPAFWNEEWLKLAIDELDKRAMSPEELLDYEMTLSANALAVKNEKKKIKEANLIIINQAVTKALLRGKLSIEEIAEDNNKSVDFVRELSDQLDKEK